MKRFPKFKILAMLFAVLLFAFYSCEEDCPTPSGCDAPEQLQLEAYDALTGEVTLSWSQGTDALEYLLVYTNTQGDSLNFISNETQLQFTLSADAQEHFFQIHSLCPNDTYAIGPAFSLETEGAGECSPPTNVEYETSGDFIIVSWQGPADALYQVDVSFDGAPILSETLSDGLIELAVPAGSGSLDVEIKTDCGDGSFSGAYHTEIIILDGDVGRSACERGLGGSMGIYVKSTGIFYWDYTSFCEAHCTEYFPCYKPR